MDPTRQALDNYKNWAKYPPSSRPANEHADQLMPHQRIPTVRPLNPDHPGKVELRQEQDRLYLVPGEVAEVSLSVSVDGTPQTIVVERAELVRVEGRPPFPSPPMANPVFRDDGVVPDATASDGRFTASVLPPSRALGGFTGDLEVVVNVRVGSEHGVVSFPFVYTGVPPAKFTGTVREALEDGSLALYVGIDIARAGRYLAIGRLFDTRGRSVAILQFNDVIDTTVRDLRLLAFGKLLHDEGAVSPFTLRDVQGWRMIEQGSPDRQMLEMWTGPYTTAHYAEDAFSDREWDSPTKRRHIEGLERVLQRRP